MLVALLVVRVQGEVAFRVLVAVQTAVLIRGSVLALLVQEVVQCVGFRVVLQVAV